MQIKRLHPWRVTVHEAAEIQRALKDRVVEAPLEIASIRYVAGADVSYSRGSDDIYAAVVVFSFPDLKPVEEQTALQKATFPYVPGFLTFREGPAVMAAFERLTIRPDVVIFDGQGIAHPRGIGIASHMGVLLDVPSIGCAKSVLFGRYEEPGMARGSTSPLIKDGRQLGVALRTRAGVAPVFVSVGHRVTLSDAIEVVLECAPRYRLPEPIRRAHNLSNALRTGASHDLR